MDSLTQIVLGAAVGEAVLGKKVGNKAMFYGAIAGTIPDLDVFAYHITDTVNALTIHRGFTHSILFSIIFGVVFGWLVSRYADYRSFKGWSLLFFLAFITHPILDAHTTWGTQLFWPFDLRLAFKTIFVIDPIYTLPFLLCLIFTMLQKRTSARRGFYNRLGLIMSTSYLLITFALKGIAYHQFKKALEIQNISYLQFDTRPAPLTTLLWSANVETDDSYLLTNYSFFDTKPISFIAYPKNHELLGSLVNDKKVQQMIAISEGWYTISKHEDQLFFNDLRFGLLSLKPNAENFVFRYAIEINKKGKVSFVEQPKDRRDGKKMLSDLWQRLKGI